MGARGALVLCAFAVAAPTARGEAPRGANEPQVDAGVERRWLCPMHAEVRQGSPGRCPRCGMALVESSSATSPAFAVTIESPSLRAGVPVRLRITVIDPRTGAAVRDLVPVHEQPMHLFLVSEDLEELVHVHPALDPGGDADGRFTVEVTLPRAGRWQAIADFLPRGGTPQVVQRTLFTDGWTAPMRVTVLAPPTVTRAAGVELLPVSLVAGEPAILSLRAPGALTRWMGAWAHVLLVAPDFSSVQHAHAERVGDRLDVPLRPPFAGRYRLWVQLEREGQLVTAPFTVEVAQKGARYSR